MFLLVSSVLTKRHVGSGNEIAVRVLFFEHTHRISFVLSAKQICGNQPTDQADQLNRPRSVLHECEACYTSAERDREREERVGRKKMAFRSPPSNVVSNGGR